MIRSMAPVAVCAENPPTTRRPDAAASSATFISGPVRRSSITITSGSSRSAAARRRQHIVVVAADLALADERLAALVHDVDLALDGDDVIAARAVHQIHERRHQRPLSARARTGHEHEPFRLDRERLHLPRQPELIGRDRARRHQAEHAARPEVVAEAHAPDAADTFDVDNPFGGGAGAQRLVTALRHQRQQQRLDVARDVHRLAIEHLEFAVDAHRRPRAGRKIQRRRAARGRHAQQPLEPGQRRVGHDGRRLLRHGSALREIGSTTPAATAHRALRGEGCSAPRQTAPRTAARVPVPGAAAAARPTPWARHGRRLPVTTVARSRRPGTRTSNGRGNRLARLRRDDWRRRADRLRRGHALRIRQVRLRR